MTAPRRRRWPWILLAILLLVPAGGYIALRAFLNPEALRPRIIAAVESATGRRFTVGEIGLGLSLSPTLALRDVALANAPGGSRPEMLTAKRMEVQLALLPLLSRRIEIARVEIGQPDLLLEVDAQGQGNWQFRPAQATPEPAPAPSGGQPSSSPHTPRQVGLNRLTLEGGRVTWRGTTTETIEIPSLQLSAPLAGTVSARGRVLARGQEIGITAQTGTLAAFGTGPWPFDVALTLPGGEAKARGSADGTNWTAEVSAQIANLGRLAPLLPDMPLLPLNDVSGSGRLAGNAASLTGADALVLRVGRTDLAMLRPGLVLTTLEATAPRLDAPLTLSVAATVNGAEVSAGGTLGNLASLAGVARGPVPVDLTLRAAGATASMRGAVQDPQALAGLDLALAAQVPDLAALTPVAGTPLPALRDIAAEARLAERTPGFVGGAHLRGLSVTAPTLEAKGELTLVIGERPGVTGRLDVARLDLDAIRAAMPSASAAQLGSPAAPAAEPAAAPERDGRLIPDLPIPAGALRTMDADLTLAIAGLTAGGAAWRDIEAKVGLDAGKGQLAPLRVTTPAGRVEAELSADATAPTPALHLVLRAPQLDIAALQRALGRPVGLTGRGELEADLRGSGAALRAVAASLDGHLGLVLLDGTVEPSLLGPLEQALRQRVPVLPPVPQRLPYACVALRADITDGTARIGTLLVDAPAAKVAGTGTVNLGTEAIALRLVHDIRAAGTVVRVGADLGGTLAAPSYRGVQAQNLAELAGAIGERIGGDVGALLGALGRPGARPEPLPDCGPALAAARGGRTGHAPSGAVFEAPPAQGQAAPGPAQRQAPQVPQVNDLLRNLLRR